MLSLLLSVHIFCMVGSLGLMMCAGVLALCKVRASVTVATLSMVFTAIGSVSGGILLLFAPLSIKCVLLTMYLIVMLMVYRYGFGMGDAKKAKLLRA